jgi:hypothetical protein
MSGGLGFIVRYGVSAPYSRPWSSQDGSEPDSNADDDISETYVGESMDSEEETWEEGRHYENPEYHAFVAAFRLAVSMQREPCAIANTKFYGRVFMGFLGLVCCDVTM